MKQLVVDLSSWDQCLISGADRVRFINGMCTSNVEKAQVGDWIRTCFLTVKGRVLAVAELLIEEQAIWCLCEPNSGDVLREHLRSHAIVDDVEFETCSRAAHRVWNTRSDVWSARPVVGAAKGEVASDEDVALWQMEAGLPRYGIEVGDANFPFESLLVRLVDFDKGCYLGQEPVARVHYRGHPSKRLCGLRFSELPAPAAEICVDGKAIGAVLSVANSPEFGPIGLAYLPKNNNNHGLKVDLAGNVATVVELPFG